MVRLGVLPEDRAGDVTRDEEGFGEGFAVLYYAFKPCLSGATARAVSPSFVARMKRSNMREAIAPQG